MNIGIIGLGLIGGTYAKSLKKYPYKIYGVDINQESIEYALKNGIIDYGTTSPSKDFLRKMDVVFLCLYPKDITPFIRKHIMSFKEGTIISDAVGIKRKIIDNLDIFKEDGVEFVFSHPIAGRETTGVNNSDASIFQNANFVITPTERNTNEGLGLIKVLAEQMGFKNVSFLSDVEHDEIISFTSQLTHAIAVALVNSDNQKYDTKLFIGDSYKDLTRIAKINETLWTELFMNNKDFLVNKIDAFQAELNKIKTAVQSKDSASLKEMMKQSTERRMKIDE